MRKPKEMLASRQLAKAEQDRGKPFGNPRPAHPRLASGSVTLRLVSMIPSDELLDAHRYFKWRKTQKKLGIKPPQIGNFLRWQVLEACRSFKQWLLGYIRAADKFKNAVPVGTPIETATALAEARRAAELVVEKERIRVAKRELAGMDLSPDEEKRESNRALPPMTKREFEQKVFTSMKKLAARYGEEDAARMVLDAKEVQDGARIYCLWGEMGPNQGSLKRAYRRWREKGK